MTYRDFPSLADLRALGSVAITYPDDTWSDPDEVSMFEDQRSVEVRNINGVGFWELLNVTIMAQEPAADAIFAFLRDQRLRGIPFYFNHRKRGRILVRYWNNKLPMKRRIGGRPDLMEFDLPLRQE